MRQRKPPTDGQANVSETRCRLRTLPVVARHERSLPSSSRRTLLCRFDRLRPTRRSIRPRSEKPRSPGSRFRRMTNRCELLRDGRTCSPVPTRKSRQCRRRSFASYPTSPIPGMFRSRPRVGCDRYRAQCPRAPLPCPSLRLESISKWAVSSSGAFFCHVPRNTPSSIFPCLGIPCPSS